jgi:hypothetical protein
MAHIFVVDFQRSCLLCLQSPPQSEPFFLQNLWTKLYLPLVYKPYCYIAVGFFIYTETIFGVAQGIERIAHRRAVFHRRRGL